MNDWILNIQNTGQPFSHLDITAGQIVIKVSKCLFLVSVLISSCAGNKQFMTSLLVALTFSSTGLRQSPSFLKSDFKGQTKAYLCPARSSQEALPATFPAWGPVEVGWSGCLQLGGPFSAVRRKEVGILLSQE